MKARVIAFYLPQFHPTPNNDVWWGRGFTEWTNVGKAKPLFKGHYQPKVPADLGYYDLRLPEVREAQAELAKKAGIEGFCYYHYWFGDGRQELELPFNEVLKLGEPDFPFCLCWANESWHSKFWSKSGNSFSKQILVEQKYLGKEDNEKHFYKLLPAFKDKRYLKIDGKPIFMIYRPFDFIGIREFIQEWQRLAIENGLTGIHFLGQIGQINNNTYQIYIDSSLSFGLDGINIVRLWSASYRRNFCVKVYEKIISLVTGVPRGVLYKNVYHSFVGEEEYQTNIYPTLIPNWDHTPRSGNAGYVVFNSSPKLFQKHVEEVLERVECKPIEDRIVFLKSWNEWGEGNYMEPDLRYGLEYIHALRNAIL